MIGDMSGTVLLQCWCGKGHPTIGTMLGYDRVSALTHKAGRVWLGLRDVRVEVPWGVPPRLTGEREWKEKP